MLQHVSIPIVHHRAEIAGRMQAAVATVNTSHAYKCVDLTCMHYVICRGLLAVPSVNNVTLLNTCRMNLIT